MRVKSCGSPSLLGAVLAMTLASLSGCGSPPPAPDDDGAASSRAGKSSSTSGSGAKGSSDSSGASGSGGGAAGIDGDEPAIPPHIPVYDPDYPGLDEALVPDVPVPGCEDGFDPDSATITFSLDRDAYGVWLSAQEGVLYANGRECEVEGSPMQVDQLDRIQVTGGPEDNVVLLDLSKGEFGARLLEADYGFHFELGSGTDHFMLRGTAGDDSIYGSGAQTALLAALSELPRLNLWVDQLEELTYSLGPGNDTFDEVGRLNVGKYDDRGVTARVEDPAFPVNAFGGEGDDVLRGGQMSDFFAGGPGDDVMNGGEGGDYFDEGASSSGRDLINAGPGLDTVSYQYRAEDLTVVLCMADTSVGCTGDCDCEAVSGELEEYDTLINLEIARSGSGNDHMLGSDGDDYLYGEAGDDLLEGGPGSDVLQGGVGFDQLMGGADEDICDADEQDMAMSCEI